MKVYVKYFLEETCHIETGETSLDSVSILQKAFSVLENLIAKYEESPFPNPTILKKFMPHIVVAYLIEEMSNASFMKGQNFAEQCREQGVISFSKPPEDTHIARIEFEKEPNPRLLPTINRDLLKLSEVITENIENIVFEWCHEFEIDPKVLVMMHPVHWVVCAEHPETDWHLLFPDER